MRTLASTPGLRFDAVRPRTERSPLRSDIAGFIGRTHRGPVDRVVRVEGWREYQLHFGGLDAVESMSYAVYGYFENGGQIAHIRRVSPNAKIACADWVVASDPSNPVVWAIPLELPNSRTLNGHACKVAKIVATSPGAWARGLTVAIHVFQLRDKSLRFDFQVCTKYEERERFQFVLKLATNDKPDEVDVVWTDFELLVAEKSALIRIVREAASGFDWAEMPANLSDFTWEEVTLDFDPAQKKEDHSNDATWILDQFDSALAKLMEEPEVALVAFPDFEKNITNPQEFLAKSCRLAAQTQDRILIADVPDGFELKMLGVLDQERRCIALYEPRLLVNDSNGSKTLNISASGHVAGVMSRVDRERGAHHTPANVTLLDAIDLAESNDPSKKPESSPSYINHIRCTASRGLMIWGGRTLDETPDGRFIAHRRFIHRLIRAIRRAAEPIVFEVNSPELRRMLTRAVTTVLLEAYRGGALIGERPDEAFFVKCDESINPFVERELGRVVCEIGLALAAPMEFITIRVMLSQEGNVEVFES